MDREQFGRLYNDTASRLLAFLVRSCGERELAEDLLQESYIRIYRSKVRFESPEHARRYLYTIAVNLVRDSFRRRRRRGEVREAVDVTVRGRNTDDAIDLERALARLSPRDRSIVLLAYGTRMSRSEIAEATGLKPASVGVVLHRIRKRLVRWLRAEDL